MHKLEVSAPGWKLSAPFHVRPDAEESDLALLTEADKKTLRAAAHMAFGPEMLQSGSEGVLGTGFYANDWTIASAQSAWREL